jgi:hypothetical protein
MTIKRGKLQTRRGWKLPVEHTEKENSAMTEQVKAETESKSPVAKTVRRERVPFGGSRRKLSYPPKEGKVRRWVNDVGGRPQLAAQGGYEFVVDEGLPVGDTAVGSGNTDLGSRVSRIVGKNADGSPLTAFLMEIDQDLYSQDQAEKQKPLDAIDDQIRSGKVSGGIGPQDKAYIPKEGITYKP